MKKILGIAAAAVLALSFASCKEKTADLVVRAYDEATQKLDNSTSAGDVVAVQTELNNTIEDLQAGKDTEYSAEDQKKIDAAKEKFSIAASKKALEFGPGVSGTVDVETFQIEPDGSDQAEATGAAEEGALNMSIK